jgi:hypothetical protein
MVQAMMGTNLLHHELQSTILILAVLQVAILPLEIT